MVSPWLLKPQKIRSSVNKWRCFCCSRTGKQSLPANTFQHLPLTPSEMLDSAVLCWRFLCKPLKDLHVWAAQWLPSSLKTSSHISKVKLCLCYQKKRRTPIITFKLLMLMVITITNVLSYQWSLAMSWARDVLCFVTESHLFLKKLSFSDSVCPWRKWGLQITVTCMRSGKAKRLSKHSGRRLLTTV